MMFGPSASNLNVTTWLRRALLVLGLLSAVLVLAAGSIARGAPCKPLSSNEGSLRTEEAGTLALAAREPDACRYSAGVTPIAVGADSWLKLPLTAGSSY